MTDAKIVKLLNEQIAKEQFAAQLYLSMSAWFSSRDLDGIANYFRVQAKEELFHADKIFDYINDIGGEIELEAIDKPENKFKNAEEIFEKALAHEKLVTQSIFNILKTANEVGDYATTSFLQWFVNEQVEEEANASQLLSKIRMVANDSSALYLFNQELAQRVYVEEA